LCCCLKKKSRTATRLVSTLSDYENQLNTLARAKDTKIQSISPTQKAVNPPNSPDQGKVHSNTNDNCQKNPKSKKESFGFTELSAHYSSMPPDQSRKSLRFDSQENVDKVLNSEGSE
jgi:hypothetical protein